jgi:hypothetical protein
VADGRAQVTVRDHGRAERAAQAICSSPFHHQARRRGWAWAGLSAGIVREAAALTGATTRKAAPSSR